MNFGYSYKSITSQLSDNNGNAINVNSKCYDVGTQITFPFISLIEGLNNEEIKFPDNTKPFFNLSLGYAVKNIGDKIYYIDPKQTDPLPKLAVAGYGISTGLNTKYNNNDFNLFKFEVANEARDVLTKWDGFENNYINSPGRIKFIDNIILGKSGNEVSIYQGWQFEILESFRFSNGRFKGTGYPSFQKTSGFSISINGLIKWLNKNYSNSTFEFLSNHFDLRFSKTIYTSRSPLNDTMFEGISISLFGF